MKHSIIMLTGEARSGKDTSADIIEGLCKAGNIPVTRTFFAKALKESAKEVFGYTDEHVYGSLKETVATLKITAVQLLVRVSDQLRSGHLSFIPKMQPERDFGNIVQEIVRNMLGAMRPTYNGGANYQCSPRQIMQWWGTEAVRVGAYDAAWIDAVADEIKQSSSDIAIISDARFDNEIIKINDMFLQSDVKVIKLLRGDKPKVHAHISEAGVSPWLIDYTITNDGSIQDLRRRIGMALLSSVLILKDKEV